MMNKKRLEKIDKKVDMSISIVDQSVTVVHKEDFDPNKEYGGIVIKRPEGCR